LPNKRPIQRRITKKGIKELSDAYLESTGEFSQMLKERTPGEIAYDSEVVGGLRRGLPILKALELAKEKYPDEALQWDDDTIADIQDHYEYLMNHEDILSKLKALSSKK
jgi:rubrerythrin